MRATIRLGRVAGVQVGLHWSVLGIVVLLIMILSVRLPNIADGYPWGMYLLAAAVTAVLFVASLFAHEMAHAIVAERNRVDVEGITLGCSAEWPGCAARH
jgi:Zn-dependent protease